MASSLDSSLVRHVAHLARLEVSEEEVARFADQLSSILNYMEQLNELDTAGIQPTAHAVRLTNVFREDQVRPGWDQDRALQNAPARHGEFFKVPKVLDQESA